ALDERHRRQAVGRAHARHEREHALTVDQLTHRGYGPCRVVTVVARREHKVATVDTALVVHVLEVRLDRYGDGAPRGRRTGLRAPVADDDLGVGDPFLRHCKRADQRYDEAEKDEPLHVAPLPASGIARLFACTIVRSVEPTTGCAAFRPPNTLRTA